MRQPILRSELDTMLADPGVCACYVSPGLAPLVADGFVPAYHVRVALFPRSEADAMAADLDRWREEAAQVVGAMVAWSGPGELIAPAEGGPWARVEVGDRARLLAGAVACAARHAGEIAVLDLGETAEPGFLAMLRRERLGGGPAMLGATIEQAFFSLLHERVVADARELVVMVPWPGPGDVPATGASAVVAAWDGDRVVAPAGALAGLVLASLAEVVVCQRLALRQHPPPAPLAADLAAVLAAGHELLAPHLCNLLPRGGRERPQ